MKVTVVITTDFAPTWLQKVLWGYECQTYDNFELIVADHGGFAETAQILSGFLKRSHLQIHHLKHPAGHGSRAKILNDAVVSTEADYCVFSNDHCVPRNDFVEAHMKMSRRGRYLTGGTFNLPLSTSEQVDRQDIATLFAFELRWLLLNGWKPGWIAMQLVNLGVTSGISSSFPWNPANWNAHNSSAYKDDIVSINGFNEVCPSRQVEGEFNIRLINKRLEGIAINTHAVCLHLKEVESDAKVDRKKEESFLSWVPKDATWINTGIIKGDKPEAHGTDGTVSVHEHELSRHR